MKKYSLLSFLYFATILFILSLSVQAQSPSTQGMEFFLGFMRNGYRSCNGSAFNENLTVIASAQRACSVTITNPNTGWSTTRAITANGLVNITIPAGQAYSTESDTIENKGFIITSTDTISLFLANEATNSFDASFVLPTSSLLDEYVVQNHVPMISNNSTCPDRNKSVFLIVATEDNTVIDITVKKATLRGQPANVPFTIVLQRGQSYQVISALGGENGDFSGSHIKARDCKKITVFNGNVLTTIPDYLSNGLDHIFEQAMPTAYWGKEFVVTSSAFRSGGDFVKITALEDNTQVRQNGALLTTLAARSSYMFLLSSYTGASFIETSGPAAVNLYQTTSDFDGSTLGDPSMVWISPVEQQIKDITFGTFAAQSITVHYVNVVTKTSDIGSIMLDNNSISSSFSVVPGNRDYSYARVPINPGTHRLNSNTGFTAHVYGFGNAQGYAYSVGSSTLNLTREIYLNDIASFQIDENYFVCLSDSIKLDIISNTQFDSIAWDLGNGVQIFQDSSFVYQYPDTGLYTITNIVKLDFVNCAGSLYDTLQMKLRVKPNLIIDLYDSICPGPYSNWGFEFMAHQDTVLIDSTTTLDDCAIAVLHLKVFPPYTHVDTARLCEHEFPLYYGNEVFRTPGSYIVHFPTINGCDSTILLEIIIDGVVDYFYEDTTCIGASSYNHYGFNIPEYEFLEEGTFLHERFSNNENGCDSNIYLSLRVVDPKMIISMLIEPFCENHYSFLQAVSQLPHIYWNTKDSVSIIRVDTVGTYIATAYGYNCTTTDSLIVERCCPPEGFMFPNIITPSTQDGLNDFFSTPEGFNVFKSEIYIYNRYGKLVYKNKDNHFSWDGTTNGKVVPGVYYYDIIMNNYCRYHGSITVY